MTARSWNARTMVSRIRIPLNVCTYVSNFMFRVALCKQNSSTGSIPDLKSLTNVNMMQFHNKFWIGKGQRT